MAALGLCALPVMAQTPPPPAQQTPTQPQPAQATPQTPPPQAPAQQAAPRPGYYQFPQPAPAAPAPQYPRYYQYPAQSPPPPPPQYVAVRPAVTEPLVRWHIDGGWSEPAGRSSDYLQGGYSAGLGMSVALGRGSPFDLRFDANYDRNNATQALIDLNQNASDSVDRGREEIWSGTLDLEMHLPLGGGAGVYFFGGGGEYNMSLSFREPLYALGGYPGGYYCGSFGFCGGFGGVKTSSDTLTKFGWNAGAGIEGPLSSGVKWFVEGRYNRIQQSNLAGPLAFIPVTVGLRF
jgi:opacity protein-like surface antigen